MLPRGPCGRFLVGGDWSVSGEAAQFASAPLLFWLAYRELAEYFDRLASLLAWASHEIAQAWRAGYPRVLAEKER